MTECIIILFLAVIIDTILGDPVYSVHPVRLTGQTIILVENILRRIRFSGIIGGGFLVIFTILIIQAAYFLAKTIPGAINSWAVFAFNIFIVYSCIGFRDLIGHAHQVADALESDDLLSARQSVQNIVGRKTNLLDSFGVARAAIESVAENFVDGLLAPVFWFVTGCLVGFSTGLHPGTMGAVGILTYRVVNTLDSMVGYRNQRYLYFGRISARLDDFMNFLPARLSVPVITLAAALCGMRAYECWKTARRDRLKHPSPNAGHAESCVAGALNLRLAGPTHYPDGVCEKLWIGTGSIEVSYADIRKCCKLIRVAELIAVISFSFSITFLP